MFSQEAWFLSLCYKLLQKLEAFSGYINALSAPFMRSYRKLLEEATKQDTLVSKIQCYAMAGWHFSSVL